MSKAYRHSRKVNNGRKISAIPRILSVVADGSNTVTLTFDRAVVITDATRFVDPDGAPTTGVSAASIGSGFQWTIVGDEFFNTGDQWNVTSAAWTSPPTSLNTLSGTMS